MTAARRNSSISLYFHQNGVEINAAAFAEESFTEDSFLDSIRQTIRWWYGNNPWMEVTTSGSTGKPHTIRFSRPQIQGSIARSALALQLNSSQKALLCLDPKYIGGKMMLLRALQLGMDLICVEPISNPLLKNLPSFDFTALVPLQVDSILANPLTASRLKSIGTIIIGGAAINAQLEKILVGSPNQIYQTYGMTETISHIALRNLSRGESDFKALPGVTLSMDDRNCLVATLPEFDKPVTTNDLIEITGTNQFRWLGRIDHIINTGGVKVLPEVLEQKLSEAMKKFNPITGFFFAGSPDDRLGEHVTMVIECRQPNIPDRRLLIDSIQSAVSRFELPREIRRIDEFIKTPGGKLDRKASLAQSTTIIDSETID
ncbi:MAG: AMP-binding protein [Bacteroidota bacterium]